VCLLRSLGNPSDLLLHQNMIVVRPHRQCVYLVSAPSPTESSPPPGLPAQFVTLHSSPCPPSYYTRWHRNQRGGHSGRIARYFRQIINITKNALSKTSVAYLRTALTVDTCQSRPSLFPKQHARYVSTVLHGHQTPATRNLHNFSSSGS
jgi:hypothetical protein